MSKRRARNELLFTHILCRSASNETALIIENKSRSELGVFRVRLKLETLAQCALVRAASKAEWTKGGAFRTRWGGIDICRGEAAGWILSNESALVKVELADRSPSSKRSETTCTTAGLQWLWTTCHFTSIPGSSVTDL